MNVYNLRLRSDSIPQAAQRGHTILHKWDSSIRIPFLQSPSGKLNRSINIRPCSQNCCFDFLPFQPTWNSCPLLQYCRSFSPIQHCCKRLRLFSQRFSSVESFVLRQTLWSDRECKKRALMLRSSCYLTTAKLFVIQQITLPNNYFKEV